MRELKIWDLPIRVFHWCFAALILAAWGTAEWDIYPLHYYCGYAIMTLLLFRISWGVVGSDTARFAAFLPSPTDFFRYLGTFLKKRSDPSVGHNPMGALAVIAMLAVAVSQVVTGLFAQDINFVHNGPLVDMIEYESGLQAAELHHDIFHLLQILIIAHIAAVAFYVFYKKQNIVRAMMTGWRELTVERAVTPPTLMPVRRAVLLVAISSGIVLFVVNLLPML